MLSGYLPRLNTFSGLDSHTFSGFDCSHLRTFAFSEVSRVGKGAKVQTKTGDKKNDKRLRTEKTTKGSKQEKRQKPLCHVWRKSRISESNNAISRNECQNTNRIFRVPIRQRRENARVNNMDIWEGVDRKRVIIQNG